MREADVKTRADAEQYVRSVRRRCQGARVNDLDELKALAEAEAAQRKRTRLDQWQAMAEMLETGRAEGRTVNDLIRAHLQAGDQPTVRALNKLSRRGCGGDVNNEIVKQPFDRSVRYMNCPKCGLQISYLAPAFPGVE